MSFPVSVLNSSWNENPEKTRLGADSLHLHLSQHGDFVTGLRHYIKNDYSGVVRINAEIFSQSFFC